MINPQIISLLHDVEDELSLLNILREDLIEAGKRGYAEWNNATPNDPPGTAGNNAYKATVRAIRDLLIPKQWKRQDKDNIPFTTNAELKIALVVSSGTQDVGVLEGKPRTRNRKGEKTKAYVYDNRDIFGIEEKIQKAILPDFQTFVFLYFYDFKKGEIRLELSLPIDMDAHGHVSEWHKRIILEAIPFDVEPTPAPKQSFDDVQNIDISIKRRKK